jgi:4-alpha-glucanotransferase
VRSARVPTLRMRASGVLMHLSSLPGRHGCGDMGIEARAFVDFLARASQRWWQMLPIGPPGFGESPYSAQSAFAGNPFFVSLDDLAQAGLADASTLEPPFPMAEGRVDPAPMEAHRMRVLRAAFERWLAAGDDPAYERFCALESGWLEEFALFRALKRAHGGVQWTRWARDVRLRDSRALADARRELARDVAFEKFVQFVFAAQWAHLRAYAAARGVGLIGDIPLVVAHDSADVWQHPSLFFLDAEGEPTAVAGVPPDYFSATGQRWGNPLYRWRRMKKRGYAWWIERLRVMLRRFDAIRIDHFIGFLRYWRIPADCPTAIDGRWMKGPGADFFSATNAALGALPLIAEDLGAATPAVFALRDRFGFPGIKILQFAFGKDPFAYTFLPHNYVRNAVVFTGTHDNDTTVGWFRDQGGGWSTRSSAESESERDQAMRYLGTDGSEIHWDMIRAAFASVANLAIVPLQDILGLDSSARMNRPGTGGSNWTWRVEPSALTPAIALRLSTLAHTYGRTREARR